jgi:hypothetical protein
MRKGGGVGQVRANHAAGNGTYHGRSTLVLTHQPFPFGAGF